METQNAGNSIGHHIGAAVSVFIVTLLGVSSPFLASKYGKKDLNLTKHMSPLSNLAGGALLSMGLLHILPESLENMACQTVSLNGTTWQYGYAITLFGVVIVLGIDVVIRIFGAGLTHNNAGQNQVTSSQFEVITSGPEKKGDSSIKAELLMQQEITLKRTSSAIITSIALFVHSLFDGLIIGSQDRGTDIWIVTAIILAHKVIAAISVGISLLSSGLSKKQIIGFGGAFIIATPLGLIIFALIPMSSFVNGFLGCLSTGALIFVAFEMAFANFDSKTNNTIHVFEFIGFLCGCILITGVNMLEVAYAHKYHVHAHCDHSHDHGHSHGEHHGGGHHH